MDDSHADRTPPSAEPPSAGGYVVVARRYRPQTFEQLLGQEHVSKALTGAIASGRVGHAYLFTGARGVGKTSAARILAKAINCTTGPTATPCNRCDLCQSVSTGNDVDVLEIDGASNRGIDEIRELRQNVNVRPSRARSKIYIIDEVHMLTTPAFNALLKTLEEPPEHVKFIFCTTEPEKIPITILSRCQRFDFAGLDAAAISRRLAEIAAAEGVIVEPQALAYLARRAAGSMRDSQSLLEQLLAFGERNITVSDVLRLLGAVGSERLRSLVTHLSEHDAASALADMDAAVSEGADVGQLLDQLLGYFRDVLAAAVGRPASAFLHASPDDEEAVRQAAESMGAETLLAVMQIISETLARLRYSTHGRVLAELALVRIARLDRLTDLSELVQQLRSGVIASAPGATVPRPPATTMRSESPKKKWDDAPQPRSDSPIEPSEDEPVERLPLTQENAAVVWRKVLDGVTDLIADHAALGEHAAISAPNHLVVSFPSKYNSNKAFCELPEQAAKLERALNRLTGERIKLEFALLADEKTKDDGGLAGHPSPATERRAARPQEQLGEKRNHPFVRRAVELFEARPLRVDARDTGETTGE